MTSLSTPRETLEAGCYVATIEYIDILPDISFSLVRALVTWSTGQQSEGWGRSFDRVLAGKKAIGEAIERHAFCGLPPAREAFEIELDAVLPHQTIVGLMDEQYDLPKFPCKRYDPGGKHLWLPVRSVLDTSSRWVLADCVVHPHAFAENYRSRLIVHATSSGCAAAHDLDTAIYHGVCELIERDAFMRHWFSQEAGVNIELTTLPENHRKRVGRLLNRGFEIGVQSLNSKHVPVIMVWAQHKQKFFTSLGLGCNLDAESALGTALGEMEVQAYARYLGVLPETIEPSDVFSPQGHAGFYAQKAHYNKADAILKTSGRTTSWDRAIRHKRLCQRDLYRRLADEGHPVYWAFLANDTNRSGSTGAWVSVRALIPGLIPMAFGTSLQPRAFDLWRKTEHDAIHPFA